METKAVKYDSLIFDLDGTLWDATSTYAQAWSECLGEAGSDIFISSNLLLPIMGMEQAKALALLLPNMDEKQRNEIYENVSPRINCLIPKIGGKLYPGVKEGIAHLAERYSLFIVSNCPKGLIPAFLEWTGLKRYFSSHLAYGDTAQSKSINIQKLKNVYKLKNSIYIGDTDLDRIEAELAEVRFVFVKYGFGDCRVDTTVQSFDTFKELVNYFVNNTGY